MKKEKVVYVISRIDYALAFDWVDQYINKDKFELHFIFLNPSSPKLHTMFKDRGTFSYFIPFSKKLDYPSVAFKLLKLFNKIKPDVVHLHLIDACLTAMPVAYLMGVKKRIYTRHHSTYHFDYFPHAVKYDKFLNRLATKIIAISDNVKDVLINKEKADPSRVTTVHHGFELKRFVEVNQTGVDKLKSIYNPEGKSPVIGVISRFTEWKGVQYIIPAFQKLLNEYPDALLILANAQGDMEVELFNQLQTLKEGSYKTIKFENDLYSLYQLFDVFVHVPIDLKSEAFGQTYVEALAAGIPSVFTLSGIATEFIQNEKNALVVDYKNTDEIYQGVVRLLSDSSLRAQLKQKGQSDVMEKFDISKMINALEGLYAS